MDAKLNIPDISLLLAKQCDISVSKAEIFSKQFFDIIIEGLDKDGLVKINGLGTFKIIDVASRGSVNINTGEKIEIKGHRKITFIPAETLKDKVNEAFAMFEPVEVTDEYTDDEECIATNEIVETTTMESANAKCESEEIVATESAEEQKNIADDTPDIAETVETADTADTDACSEPDAPVVGMAQAPTDAVSVVAAPDAPAETASSVSEPLPTNNAKKKRKALRYIIAAVALLVVAIGVPYMLHEEQNTVEKANVVVEEKTPATVSAVVKDTVADEIVATTENEKTEFVLIDELKQIPLSKISLNDTVFYKSHGDMAIHKVGVDETLTKIALKYYDDKKLWPYLVKYNNLGNHNQLEIGMELKIPVLVPRK